MFFSKEGNRLMADSNKVYIGTMPAVGGTFHRARLGTAVPTDATTALAGAYLDHGYVSEDGYTYSINRETTDHKAFGGDTVATSQDDYNEELTVTLIEADNAEVLKTTFGDDNVDVSGDTISVTRNKSALPRSVFVVDTEGDGGRRRRLVIPNGKVINIGEITITHTGLMSYPLTIKPYPDTSGNTSYEYVDNPALGS